MVIQIYVITIGINKHRNEHICNNINLNQYLLLFLAFH